MASLALFLFVGSLLSVKSMNFVACILIDWVIVGSSDELNGLH